MKTQNVIQRKCVVWVHIVERCTRISFSWSFNVPIACFSTARLTDEMPVMWILSGSTLGPFLPMRERANVVRSCLIIRGWGRSLTELNFERWRFRSWAFKQNCSFIIERRFMKLWVIVKMITKGVYRWESNLFEVDAIIRWKHLSSLPCTCVVRV